MGLAITKLVLYKLCRCHRLACRNRHRTLDRILHFTIIPSHTKTCREWKNRPGDRYHFGYRLGNDFNDNPRPSRRMRYHSFLLVCCRVRFRQCIDGTLRYRYCCRRNVIDTGHHPCHRRIRADRRQCGRKRRNE